MNRFAASTAAVLVLLTAPAARAAQDPARTPCPELLESAGAVWRAQTLCGFEMGPSRYTAAVQRCLASTPEAAALRHMGDGINAYHYADAKFGRGEMCRAMRKRVLGADE